jgi:hypothetical protein
LDCRDVHANKASLFYKGGITNSID